MVNHDVVMCNTWTTKKYRVIDRACGSLPHGSQVASHTEVGVANRLSRCAMSHQTVATEDAVVGTRLAVVRGMTISTLKNIALAFGCVLALTGCNEKTETSAEETADLVANQATERISESRQAVQEVNDEIEEGAEEINAAIDDAEEQVESAVAREVRGEAAAVRARAETIAAGAAATAAASQRAAEQAEREAESQ